MEKAASETSPPRETLGALVARLAGRTHAAMAAAPLRRCCTPAKKTRATLLAIAMLTTVLATLVRGPVRSESGRARLWVAEDPARKPSGDRRRHNSPPLTAGGDVPHSHSREDLLAPGCPVNRICVLQRGNAIQRSSKELHWRPWNLAPIAAMGHHCHARDDVVPGHHLGIARVLERGPAAHGEAHEDGLAEVDPRGVRAGLRPSEHVLLIVGAVTVVEHSASLMRHYHEAHLHQRPKYLLPVHQVEHLPALGEAVGECDNGRKRG
mmetsp:Transcript_36604/g.73771  ORF Transcript_36604/g.73771 Transcript_36604/m.73771 type:complete len:266 (+) Transcript_36604:112-909(+)